MSYLITNAAIFAVFAAMPVYFLFKTRRLTYLQLVGLLIFGVVVAGASFARFFFWYDNAKVWFVFTDRVINIILMMPLGIGCGIALISIISMICKSLMTDGRLEK